jgi:hypothetical protein
MDVQLDTLMTDFLEVAKLSGIEIAPEAFSCEVLEAPHTRPRTMPRDKQIVLAFCTETHCLSIDVVAHKQKERFISRPYHPHSAKESLAALLLNDSDKLPEADTAGLPGKGIGFVEIAVGKWIEDHTSRYHFCLDKDQPEASLALLAVFLYCRLKPVFEEKFA